MEIQRKKYVTDLANRMQNGMVKVITGIRRSGKTYLLFRLFKKYLLELGVEDSHMISVALDQRTNRRYRNPDVFLEYVAERITDQKTYYVFLDEVQLLEDFEEALSTLLYMENIDIYVTGSNSKFLSKDVITEFRGRGDEIHIFPLTFREYMQTTTLDEYRGWAEYVTYGGLPLVAMMKTEEQKIQYLTRLFEETYIKDIRERNKIEKVQELNDLINVLASATGSLTNPSRLEATFKSVVRSDISVNTIREYIGYLENAFLLNEAQRYDVKGRKYIGTPVKYYFEDTGLRNARLGFRQTEENHLMENVIYNELRARGFHVDVGVVPIREVNLEGVRVRKQLEIDFIATLGSRKYYIQSAFSLPDKEKLQQEKNSLLQVNDSFKKIIVTKDVVKLQRDERGIITMNLYDFLLKENSLEL